MPEFREEAFVGKTIYLYVRNLYNSQEIMNHLLGTAVFIFKSLTFIDTYFLIQQWQIELNIQVLSNTLILIITLWTMNNTLLFLTFQFGQTTDQE